jgi:hypothetical protein
MTLNERGPVQAALVHHARAANAPEIRHQTLKLHAVHEGFVDLGASEIGDATGSYELAPICVLGAHEPEPVASGSRSGMQTGKLTTLAR